MSWVVAAAVGLLGLLAIGGGIAALCVAVPARRAFEAALADDGDDGLRARGVIMLERIRHPALRLIVNRRTGAMAGAVVVGVVRDRLTTLFRSAILGMVVGAGLVILAVALPGLMA